MQVKQFSKYPSWGQLHSFVSTLHNFPVDGEVAKCQLVADLSRGGFGETGVMDFGLYH